MTFGPSPQTSTKLTCPKRPPKEVSTGRPVFHWERCMYHTEYALAVISYGAAPNRFSKKMDLPCFFFPFRTWIPRQHKPSSPPKKGSAPSLPLLISNCETIHECRWRQHEREERERAEKSNGLSGTNQGKDGICGLPETFFLIPGLRQHEAERTGFCMRGRGHFLHCFIGCIESDGVERLWYGHSVYCYQGCSILG